MPFMYILYKNSSIHRCDQACTHAVLPLYPNAYMNSLPLPARYDPDILAPKTPLANNLMNARCSDLLEKEISSATARTSRPIDMVQPKKIVVIRGNIPQYVV
jgi:hypothetical protein